MATNTNSQISYDEQSYNAKKSEFQSLVEDIKSKKAEVNSISFNASAGPTVYQVRMMRNTLSSLLTNMELLVTSSITHLDKIAQDVQEADSKS